MLTKKQRTFVEEYLTDFNATQAAIRAGYSQKTAGSQGQRLLKNVEINDVIEKHHSEMREKNEITVDKITQFHIDAIEIAREQKSPSVMTAAANNLAKLHGLITDKSKNENTEKRHEDWVREVFYISPDGTNASGEDIQVHKVD